MGYILPISSVLLTLLGIAGVGVNWWIGITTARAGHGMSPVPLLFGVMGTTGILLFVTVPIETRLALGSILLAADIATLFLKT